MLGASLGRRGPGRQASSCSSPVPEPGVLALLLLEVLLVVGVHLGLEPLAAFHLRVDPAKDGCGVKGDGDGM